MLWQEERKQNGVGQNKRKIKEKKERKKKTTEKNIPIHFPIPFQSDFYSNLKPLHLITHTEEKMQKKGNEKRTIKKRKEKKEKKTNPHRKSRVKKAGSHKPSVRQAFSARRPLSRWSSTLGVARRGSTLQKLIVK